MTTRNHLIIDADCLVYRAALAHQMPAPFEEDHDLLHDWCDLKLAKAELDSLILRLEERFEAAETTLVLSGPGSFRKRVMPTYKGNRIGRRPLAWAALREYLQERGALMEPELEGDDLAAMAATAPQPRGLSAVVWSIDKDFFCVPCRFARDDADPVTITEEEADLFHLRQTLEGDRTDGYPGARGVGPAKSEAIARRGWAAVAAQFESEEDALANARVARILRHGEYDFETQTVTLWTPSPSPTA